jgi:hypothetical protein
VAYQTDGPKNPNNYEAPYYAFEFNAHLKPVMAGAGYEVLGSDKGISVQTPLATLHKFNGWADAFLVTPPDGLQDLWIQGGVTFPANIPFRLIYHKFWTDRGGRDLGQEVDAVLSRKFGKYFSALAKYAYYDGPSGVPDAHKFWLQATFNY